eukprot:91416-Chlamydomonas_euryale.AAC.6
MPSLQKHIKYACDRSCAPFGGLPRATCPPTALRASAPPLRLADVGQYRQEWADEVQHAEAHGGDRLARLLRGRRDWGRN